MTAEAQEKYERESERKRKIRAVIIHIGLLSTLIAYSFIGAGIFYLLEKDADEVVVVELTDAKDNLVNQIWNSSLSYGDLSQIDQKNWTMMVRKLLAEYDQEVKVAVDAGIDLSNEEEYTVNKTRDWTFMKSLFYAGTVYTSIGYGHLYPISTGGRIATMIYATIGIPLCLIVLADLGGLLNEAIKYSLRSFKRLYHQCRNPKDLEDKWPRSEEIELLSGSSVFLCLIVILLLFLFAGAGMYRLWETQWSYLEAFYFIFISISTIGFGDVLPQHPNYFLLSFLYIFLGLALISTGFTVLQEIMQSTINKATEEINAKLGLMEYDRGDNTSDGEQSANNTVNLLKVTRTPQETINENSAHGITRLS